MLTKTTQSCGRHIHQLFPMALPTKTSIATPAAVALSWCHVNDKRPAQSLGRWNPATSKPAAKWIREDIQGGGMATRRHGFMVKNNGNFAMLQGCWIISWDVKLLGQKIHSKPCDGKKWSCWLVWFVRVNQQHQETCIFQPWRSKTQCQSIPNRFKQNSKWRRQQQGQQIQIQTCIGPWQ